jgi:predicted nucleic acid-binding protein
VKVIVDTSVWSHAFRRDHSADAPEALELRRLIKDFRATIIGPIRQEILSGIPNAKQFATLRGLMSAFVDEPLVAEDYECAASFFNRCRAKGIQGIQGSHVDFLICSVAASRSRPIFSTDKDFVGYAKELPIKLYKMKVS